MNLSNIIIQGGLTQRATEDYDAQRNERAYAQRARQHGVLQMDQAEALMPGQRETEMLKQQIARNELEYQRATQGAEQGIRDTERSARAADIIHQRATQPARQALDRGNLELAGGQQGLAREQANLAGKLQPGQAALATEGQNVQLQTMREQQLASLWSLAMTGDLPGALDLLNKSQMVAPGRKFTAIERGAAPAMGNDGKPLVQNGQPVTENVIKFTAGDGKEDMFVPERALNALVTKHKSSVQKAGNNVIRINPDGSATPVYEADQFAANPETGALFNKRTGQTPSTAIPPAAGGIMPPGAPGALPGRKQEAHIDDRVKQATAVINRYFGISDLSGLDPKSQPAYVEITASAGQKVRAGKNPEAAATEAISEHTRQVELQRMGSGAGNAGSYNGPTPWKPQLPTKPILRGTP